MAYRKVSIDDKIAKQQELVDKAKEKYDSELAKLKNLESQRDQVKKEELMDAIESSGKSVDEIMQFLQNN